MNFDLNERIYERYIRPLDRPKTEAAGLEFEFPIVNLSRQAVDFDLVHAMTESFVRTYQCTGEKRDMEGEIFDAGLPNGDHLSFDCSYNTLELSMAPETDLNILEARFQNYLDFLQSFLRSQNHCLTGMGLNPFHQYNVKRPIPNGRYRMLFHHLASWPKYGSVKSFHKHPDFGLFSCASQVQLDVSRSDLLEVLHTFTRLEPLKAVLFANSYAAERPEYLLNRDDLWDYSLHGLNPHNTGMLRTELRSLDEVVAYIRSMSLYCLERDGKYINFSPTELDRYFESPEICGEYFDGETYREITFTPRAEDLEYLRSFKLEDLTFRGTVEFRSVCSQPVCEAFTSAAFHTGLMRVLPQLTELLDEDTVLYHHGYDPADLRRMFNQKEWPSFAEPDALRGLLLRVLELAEQGLKERNRGEEHFLEPLYLRAERLLSPARQLCDGLQAGKTMEFFIQEYAQRDHGIL